MGRIDPNRGRLGKIIAAWRDLVGEETFLHARPSALSKGTLYVTVSDPIWQSELRFFDQEFIEKLNATLAPKDRLAQIRYRVGWLEGTGEAAPPAVPASPPAGGPAPAVPPELRAAVGGIEDPVLRAIMTRLAAHIDEREERTSSKHRKGSPPAGGRAGGDDPAVRGGGKKG
jgi:hypothetical protein